RAGRAPDLRGDVGHPPVHRPVAVPAGGADDQGGGQHRPERQPRKPPAQAHALALACSTSRSSPSAVTPPVTRTSTIPCGSTRNDSGTPRTPKSTFALESSITGQVLAFFSNSLRTASVESW